MSAHLDRLVALHEAQLVNLDEHRAAVYAPQPAAGAPQLSQPARLRVHDLPRDVVRGLAGVLGVTQHGRDLGQLREAVEAALRGPRDGAEAVTSSGRAA